MRASFRPFGLETHGINRPGLPGQRQPDAPIIAWFEQNGQPFEALVERVRDPKTQVPAVENLIGPDFKVVTDPNASGTTSVISPSTGLSVQISGSGSFSFSAYHSAFAAAERSLERAITDGSYQDLMQALTSGFASIDAFIAECAAVWNYANANDQLIEPPFRRFDEKVAEWFPKIKNGLRYDKSGAEWSILKNLRDLRDDFAVHPQQAVYAVDYQKLADVINLFPRGIVDTLFKFHVYMEKRIPCSIIRARYAPEVYVS